MDLNDEKQVRPGVKVWLTKYRKFFGPGTVTLLKQIDVCGSVREACKQTDMSYSKGWTIIHAAEDQLGYSVVERSAGGKKGGGASLTENGKQLLAMFEEYERRVDEAAKQIYKEMFDDCELLKKMGDN